jgi:molybdopterin-binding protein
MNEIEVIEIVEKVTELTNKHTDRKLDIVKSDFNLNIINQIDGIKSTINRLVYGSVLAIITITFAAGINLSRINESIKTQNITNATLKEQFQIMNINFTEQIKTIKKDFNERSDTYENKVSEISDKTLLLHQRLSILDPNTPSPFSSTRGGYSNKKN